MKFHWISLLMILGVSNAYALDIQGFAVIREFGDTDTAAMFGLLPSNGSLQIEGVSGPSFLSSVGYGVGKLNQGVISHLFLKSSNPMSQLEKQELVSKYSGASVIYAEGYAGKLCTSEEIEYNIDVSGNIDGAPFTATLQFIALPSLSGDCEYHKFITITRN